MNDTARGIGPQQLQIFRFLDTVGNGTGTKNAVGDYSSAAQKFLLVPAAGTTFRVARMLVSVEDTSGMTAGEYGNLGAALTNGVIIRTEDGSGTLVDMTDGVPIKTNAQWASYCYDVAIKAWGVTPDNDVLAVRWTFAKSGQYTRLDGDAGQQLAVVLNDDFTGLVAHRFMVQGYYE